MSVYPSLPCESLSLSEKVLSQSTSFEIQMLFTQGTLKLNLFVPYFTAVDSQESAISVTMHSLTYQITNSSGATRSEALGTSWQLISYSIISPKIVNLNHRLTTLLFLEKANYGENVLLTFLKTSTSDTLSFFNAFTRFSTLLQLKKRQKRLLVSITISQQV